MSYMHIDNLYKPEAQDIFLFRQAFALEKIHGTSARVKMKDGNLTFFSGGAPHENFVSLFDVGKLTSKFIELGLDNCTVYGEAYGGKMQGMRDTYGNELKFIVFEVNVGGRWLNVPDAEEIAHKLGLEFVHYKRVSADLASLDAERDAPSVQAVRNGIEKPMPREGIVIRPIIEVTKNNGDRIIAKHKTENFRETQHHRPVTQEHVEAIRGANKIAEEYVTRERLMHVLDRVRAEAGVQLLGMERIPDIAKTMVEDVARESEGEAEIDKQARKAIGRRTVGMFRAWLQEQLANHG